MTKAGEIAAWGDDTNDQLKSAPAGDKFRVVVPGGNSQSLVIDDDGKLTLWGKGGVPTLKGALKSDRFVDAALSLQILIAIRSDNRRIQVDGLFASPGSPNADVPSTLRTMKVDSVAAGGGHCVVIGDGDHRLYQWGPLAAPCPTTTFTQVRARHGYSIGLSENRDLYMWGSNLFPLLTPPEPGGPSLDHWESDPTRNPREIAPPHDYHHRWRRDAAGHWFLPGPFVDLAAGARESGPTSDPHILALRPGGGVLGWGANSFGQCKAPDGVDFRSITAGKGFSIGIDGAGKLHHWGTSSHKVAMTFAGPGTSKPHELSTLPDGPFSSVSAGIDHIAAVGGMPLRRGISEPTVDQIFRGPKAGP